MTTDRSGIIFPGIRLRGGFRGDDDRWSRELDGETAQAIMAICGESRTALRANAIEGDPRDE